MEKDVFADVMGEIHLIGGVVRIDLVQLRPKRGEAGTTGEFERRLMMPLDGFLTSFGAMERVVNQLVERGVVTRRADGLAETQGQGGAESSTSGKDKSGRKGAKA